MCPANILEIRCEDEWCFFEHMDHLDMWESSETEGSQFYEWPQITQESSMTEMGLDETLSESTPTFQDSVFSIQFPPNVFGDNAIGIPPLPTFEPEELEDELEEILNQY
jgi:hypothetical protein